MEQLQDALQFWKEFGYYGAGIFIVLSMIAGAISFYKTSEFEKLIRKESKSADSLARNEFLDKIDAQSKQQKAFQDKQDSILKTLKIDPSDTEIKNLPQVPSIPEDNFRVENDIPNKLLKFWPKMGEWKKPIIAYPSGESEKVKGKFTSQTGVMFMVMEGTNNDHNLSFFVASGGPPATKDHFYGLQYESLPSYVIVGDDGIAMWRVNLK